MPTPIPVSAPGAVSPVGAVVQASATLFSGLLGLFVGRFSAKARTASTDKTLFIQTVTNERAVWRRELRAAVAELTAVLRTSATGTLDWSVVYRLRAEVVLRLNPECRSPPYGTPNSDKSWHDKHLFRALQALSADRWAPAPSMMARADEIELHAQSLLKSVWETSKDEARSGRLAD